MVSNRYSEWREMQGSKCYHIHLYLKPLKTQLIKMLFFSFITKSHTLVMFKPASLSHGNVKAKYESHCAFFRLKILVKDVKIVTFLFNPSQILKLYSVSMLKYSI